MLDLSQQTLGSLCQTVYTYEDTVLTSMETLCYSSFHSLLAFESILILILAGIIIFNRLLK